MLAVVNGPVDGCQQIDRRPSTDPLTAVNILKLLYENRIMNACSPYYERFIPLPAQSCKISAKVLANGCCAVVLSGSETNKSLKTIRL